MTVLVNAFSPAMVRAKKTESIPNEIFDATNELLIQRYSPGQRIIIEMEEIVQLAKNKMMKFSNPQVDENFYENNWLDIESYYRDAGWTVLFYKPLYNESFNAYFDFLEKNAKI